MTGEFQISISRPPTGSYRKYSRTPSDSYIAGFSSRSRRQVEADAISITNSGGLPSRQIA